MVALSVTFTVLSQLSVAVTFAGAGTSPIHCTVTLFGHPLKTGLVVSLTVMVCEQLALLPQKSVAVQVRTMVFGQLPDVVALSVTFTVLSQLSVAVTFAGAGTSPIH